MRTRSASVDHRKSDGRRKPLPSRTQNPLHFEDLDPHRFEDLVRQLVYTFRDWRQIEALGRPGGDEGVDIRCIETHRVPSLNEDWDDDLEENARFEERIWYIQCKRDKAIGPAKAKTIAQETVANSTEPPYGFLLAAPCDLSKRTRDQLASELRGFGVREVHTWGKSELEDQLFLPDHDHLLFAYFGVSLQVARRNRQTELRSRMAKKRQIFRALGGLDHRGWTPVLLRDPDDTSYPFAERLDASASEQPPWLTTAFRDHSNPDYVALIFKRHHAWLSDDQKEWDCVDTCSHVVPHRSGFKYLPPRDEEACERLWKYYFNEVPDKNRAWLEAIGWIHFDDILVVDDLGDAFNEPPHLLVQRVHKEGFFSHVRFFLSRDRNGNNEALDPEQLKRKKFFPETIPDVEWRRP